MQIIEIKQLPVIEQRFKALAEEIASKVELANGLVCTDENYKEIKAIRATLNKEAAALKEDFKAIKEKVLAPWNEVESLYKSSVEKPYKAADEALKLKIATVEDELKAQKQAALIEFFEEYKAAEHLDWLQFADIGIKVTMSDSLKKLKGFVLECINAIASDCKAIYSLPNGAAVMVEYQKSLNLSEALEIVREREAAIQEQAKANETKAEIYAKNEARAAAVEEIAPPREIIFPDEEKPNIRFACGKWLARKLLDAGVKAQNIDICRMNCGYTYGGIIIAPFELYHDVPNCGWRIMLPDGKRIFYATDTGSLDGIEAKGYDLYFIEANHTEDEIAEKIAEKQAAGEYAYEVRAAHTHLSKEQADRFIIENAKATSEFIYLHMHKEEL